MPASDAKDARERDIVLGLEIGAHLDGLVDACYDLADEVESGLIVAPVDLRERARRLLVAIDADASLVPADLAA